MSISNELNNIKQKIQSNYKKSDYSDEVYKGHIDEINHLYERLEGKIQYFETLERQKAEESKPIEENTAAPEKKESKIVTFFKELWKGFENLFFAKPHTSVFKTMSLEDEAVGTKSTFKQSFFSKPSNDENEKESDVEGNLPKNN